MYDYTFFKAHGKTVNPEDISTDWTDPTIFSEYQIPKKQAPMVGYDNANAGLFGPSDLKYADKVVYNFLIGDGEEHDYDVQVGIVGETTRAAFPWYDEEPPKKNLRN